MGAQFTKACRSGRGGVTASRFSLLQCLGGGEIGARWVGRHRPTAAPIGRGDTARVLISRRSPPRPCRPTSRTIRGALGSHRL